MDHHVPREIGQDSRVAKTFRVEGRDADRRSPLHSVYRMPLSSNDSQADQPIGTDNRIESRDLKDNRDIRSEKDVRLESQGDDSNKGTRHERDSHNETKGDIKTDKVTFGLVSSPLNWKDSKDFRGKRYGDSLGGSLDSRHMSHGNTPTEVGKENPTAKERDSLEAHETGCENKIDSKSEDRFKDRKDKEKERSDRRNSTQVNNNMGVNKESAKEDQEAEKLEKEKNDIPKNREISKEHMKRESWNGVEKEVSYNEKEVGDGSVKIPKHETVLPEQKKHKDVDRGKTVDGETRDMRKERDNDLEGDRPDKRFKSEKQSEDGFAGEEETGEKESEDHSCNVQHRKRIQRSRASPLVANLEARFGPLAQDNEGYFLPLPFHLRI